MAETKPKTKNKMSDLRNHLFATLEALQDTEKPMEPERARTIASVGQTIINAAALELKAQEILGETTVENFFEVAKPTNGQRALTGDGTRWPTA